jgi:hypothetical protein
VDQKRSAPNPEVKQDPKYNRRLDGGNPYVNGLRRHIEIGREKNYVTQHDLRKIQLREDQSPSAVRQNPDTKSGIDQGLYRLMCAAWP